jgi:hypothetical protein
MEKSQKLGTQRGRQIGVSRREKQYRHRPTLIKGDHGTKNCREENSEDDGQWVAGLVFGHQGNGSATQL